jgi:tetratricopeptide (TPR) repeat protein
MAKVTHGRRFVYTGKYITTAGVSAGIDGALHLTARLLGRRVADQTARYMEYHWTPEPYLAKAYSYWNPSTDERGRTMQAATAALEEKRYPEAIAALRRLTDGDKDGSAWLNLGNALFHSGDRKGSIAAFLRVPAKSPGYMTATYNLACAYALTGRKAEAVAAFKKALAAGAHKDYALTDADLAPIHDEIKKL